MNQDVFNACKHIYENSEGIVYFESPNGCIEFGGEVSEKMWLDYCDVFKETNVFKKLHLFKVTNGNFEWVETFDIENKMCDIPIDISDEIFLKLAQEAHEKNITLNQLVAEKLLEYIENKKEIV